MSMESVKSKTKVILLIIDPQVDFHPGGSLAISGANDDSERTSSLILNNIDTIDEIVVTLDTHHRIHIAHGVSWENSNGEQPKPFTLITHKEIQDGAWLPRDRSKLSHALEYTKFLEAQGRFTLCIWPEHCLIGTPGHNVAPVLNRALQEWAFARNRTVTYVNKGMNCDTEMYSAIKAEFEIPTDKSTQANAELIKQLRTADQLLVCGQALSHCVQFTFLDILQIWPVDKRDQLVLLTDASSPVGGFEEAGKKFIESIAKQGCRLASAAGPDHALPVRAEEAGSSAWTQAGGRSAWRPTDGDDDLGVRASIRGITEYFQSWLS